MLGGNKRAPSSSFGSDGRRLSGGPLQVRTVSTTFRKPIKQNHEPEDMKMTQTMTNALFQTGAKIIVQRAPVLSCLSVSLSSGLQKKFQRPMTKRRAYSKTAEEALKMSSLGVKKRLDGMSKLLARAGKGLSFKLPNTTQNAAHDYTDASSDESDDDKENSNKEPVHVEPLLLWRSPHQGGEACGLPPRMVVEIQADESGVEESVTLMKPAPAELYSNQNVFVPHVLAKWLRPHQREGVQFMYECVMGLRPFNGNGCMYVEIIISPMPNTFTLHYTPSPPNAFLTYLFPIP